MADQDGTWMTYANAAEALGIKLDSVKRRARARKWPRRTMNDAAVQVLVPADALAEGRSDNPANSIPPTPPPDDGRIAVAEARAEAAERRADETAQDRDRWRDMAEALRADLAAERARSESQVTVPIPARRPGFLSRLLGR